MSLFILNFLENFHHHLLSIMCLLPMDMFGFHSGPCRRNERTNGRTDGRTDGQTDGRTDGQTDGQTGESR